MYPVEVFLSYAHDDLSTCTELVKHLSPHVREGQLKVWHDRIMAIGPGWESQLIGQLERAGVIVLLISPSFMASEFCMTVEMPIAQERHDARDAVVVPILIERCDWELQRFAGLMKKAAGQGAIASDKASSEPWALAVHHIREAVERYRSELAPSFDEGPGGDPEVRRRLTDLHTLHSKKRRLQKELERVENEIGNTEAVGEFVPGLLLKDGKYRLLRRLRNDVRGWKASGTFAKAI